MRNLIFIAVLATSVSTLSFLEKAQGYLSGNASISGSASVNTGASGSNFLSGIQNSSFGQAVMGGINYYNQAKNGTNSGSGSGSNWQTALANSSIGNFYQQGVNFFNGGSNNGSGFIDTDVIQQTIGNSSFGEVVQTGIEFYNNLKNGNSPFNGDASSIIGSFVPFLTNASTEAKTEFYAILPNVGNMTISEFETAVNAWAAKYGLTEEVEAFNERSKNMTEQAEQRANTVVMGLPNVLNNLKAISSDKNQTVVEMHTKIMEYVNSLDEDTQDIVFIFFRSLLPPQFKKSKCTDKGNFMTNMFQKASEYFGGNKNSTGNGNGVNFGSVGSFWNSFNGNGNGNGNGNEKPHPMVGLISNFMNKNNISEEQASSVMNGVQHDGGFASIQILPAAQLNIGDGSLASDAQVGLAVIDETQVTKKNNKKQQQANKNKNKKKTTTVSPIDADSNLALEVHTQVL